MQRVCIIGLGLIGSSLARALKKTGFYNVVGYDVNPDYVLQSRDLDICHRVFDNINNAVDRADIIVLASPVSTYKNILLNIKDNIKTGAIITDVGSVKQKVINDLIGIIPNDCSFVPAHPISGTEKSGPSSGFAELFVNRFCIICLTEKSDNEAVEKITKLWRDVGSNVDILDPLHHDKALAITSHIPHLFAYGLVGTAQNVENSLQGQINHSEVIKYSAGGFRDATRVAGSDPTMWRDIFLSNKDAINEIVDLFIDDLQKLRTAMDNQDGEFIYDWLAKTRTIRKEVVELGQAEYTDPHSEEEFISLLPYKN